VEVRDAGVDDVREIQRMARITWDHTYSETIPESVRREFVSQAYSADALRRRMESNSFRRAGDHAEVFCGHVVHEAEMILRLPDFNHRTLPGKGESGESNNQVTAQ
jgi:hypothetical protein